MNMNGITSLLRAPKMVSCESMEIIIIIIIYVGRSFFIILYVVWQEKPINDSFKFQFVFVLHGSFIRSFFLQCSIMCVFIHMIHDLMKVVVLIKWRLFPWSPNRNGVSL